MARWRWSTAGYTVRGGMVLYERLEPVEPGSAGILGQLGGRMIRAGAWDQLGGMAREKELIERRVILPLAQPSWPSGWAWCRRGRSCLFGPPGNGKTTFAKGAASRLGWPFVELFPSRLAGRVPGGPGVGAAGGVRPGCRAGQGRAVHR